MEGGGETPNIIDDAQMNSWLRRIVFFSSGGAFLDGYVLSIVGVALNGAAVELGLGTSQIASIGAASLAGIFFGALAGGQLTDRFGRRIMFLLDIGGIALTSLACAFVGEAWQLIALRLLLGFFVGADYPIATSLIAEFTPRAKRAIGMGTVSASWYLGATIAVVVGLGLVNVAEGWRWMLGSAVVPCLVLLIGRADIPESPRWLTQRGRADEARKVLARVFGQAADLQDEPVRKAGLKEVFRPGYLVRIVFLGILILCQVVPMFAIYTFGPEILSALGLVDASSSILGETFISLIFLVGTVPAMYWLDTIGRRRLLIGSLAFMSAGLLVPGLVSGLPTWAIVISFGIYAFAAGGPGILQWLYPNELFPTEVRATAVGVAIAFSRIGVVISTYGMPLFLRAYGVGATMLVGGLLLALALICSIFLAPETRGMTLTQSSSVGD